MLHVPLPFSRSLSLATQTFQQQLQARQQQLQVMQQAAALSAATQNVWSQPQTNSQMNMSNDAAKSAADAQQNWMQQWYSSRWHSTRITRCSHRILGQMLATTHRKWLPINNGNALFGRRAHRSKACLPVRYAQIQAAASLANTSAMSQTQNPSGSYNGMSVSDSIIHEHTLTSLSLSFAYIDNIAEGR